MKLHCQTREMHRDSAEDAVARHTSKTSAVGALGIRSRKRDSFTMDRFDALEDEHLLKRMASNHDIARCERVMFAKRCHKHLIAVTQHGRH